MAKKTVASERKNGNSINTRAATGKTRPAADAGTAIRRQVTELRRENEKLHRQIARFEVTNFSLKNRVTALEEMLQDAGHIENLRLKRIIEEVQERTRGAGDLLSNGPF